MKKIVCILSAVCMILTMNTVTHADNQKNEISSKKYVKTIKTYVKKEKFDLISKHNTIKLIITNKIERLGMDLAYIEPTIEKIQENKNRLVSLIEFLEDNESNDSKINNLSEDLLAYLNEMYIDLEHLSMIYKSQLGRHLTDSEKIENLVGDRDAFGYKINKNETSAYDYINHYNDRVEKVKKVYNCIKEVS